MPELPDLTIYQERLDALVRGQRLEGLRLFSVFVLRTVDPPLLDLVGRRLLCTGRIGKRLTLRFEGDLSLVIHLMIAGRLRWKPAGARPSGKTGLCALDFERGTLMLTEAGSRKRASLHLVSGPDPLRAFERGGYEILTGDLPGFRAALLRENRTLKRALTDPRLFSGVGNAFSDEILFQARLSPLKLTSRLEPEQIRRLREAAVSTLESWIERIRAEVGDDFPDRVTAFRDGMAVHGRYRLPCPECGTPIQRIRYAGNECNYCAACQNEGRLLRDRALSQLLKQDWPRTLEELEERRKGHP